MLKSISLCLIFFLSEIIIAQNKQVITSFSTTIEVISKTKLQSEIAVTARIEDQPSNWIADIEIPYQKGDDIEIIEACVMDQFGNVIREVKNKEIVTTHQSNGGTFYGDQLVKSFSLNHHQYPYFIRYKYRTTENGFIGIWRWDPILYRNVSVIDAHLKVTLPTGYKIFVDEKGHFEKSDTTNDGLTTYYWKTDTAVICKKEKYSPPISSIIPHVYINPEDFFYGIPGSCKTWSNFGAWQYYLMEGLNELTVSEKMKVDQLVNGLTDKQAIIKTLYHYLQDNTRYINVSLNIGGLKPYPASYVCEKKYGDCKALTNYMKALLNYVNIKSYYSLVYADDNPVPIDTSFPGQQFNHVILSVPVDNDTIWLENTASFLPFNYLGTMTQNRFSLQVTGTDSKLIRTPALKEKDVFVESKYLFKINRDEASSVTVSKKGKGEFFEEIVSMKHFSDHSSQKEYFEDYHSLPNSELISWQINEKDRDSNHISISLNLSVPTQSRIVGNNWIYFPPSIGIPKFEPVKEREYPVRINYPINHTDSTVYDFSQFPNSTIKLPDNITLTTRFGSYSETWTRQDNSATVCKTFLLKASEYPLEEYPDFYIFINTILNREKTACLILKLQ